MHKNDTINLYTYIVSRSILNEINYNVNYINVILRVPLLLYIKLHFSFALICMSYGSKFIMKCVLIIMAI